MSRVDNALLLRDTIQKIVDDKIGKTNPGASYATVTGFNPALGIITVRYPGDDVDIEIPAGSIYPSEPGQIVRIEGPTGSRVVADVKGENLTEVKARTAQETADGKNTVNYGETPPEGTDHKDGDIWFDEGNSNMPHVWKDGDWVSIEDLRVSAIAEAQDELRQDLDTVVENGVGTKSFYKPTEPTAAESKEGDLWFDTSEGGNNELHTYVNGAWVSAADARIAAIQQAQAELASDLEDVVANGIGTRTHYTPTQPAVADSKEGDLWFDTSTAGKNALHVFTGGAWVSAADARLAELKDAQDQLASDVSTVQAAANGKSTITRSTADPTTPYTGRVDDIWWKMSTLSSGGRVIAQYRWSGTAWLTETIDNAVIANLDAAKITTGYLAAARIKANSLNADTVLINGSLGSIILRDGAITTPKIAVGAITAESGVVASLDAGKITVGTLDVARLAANSITGDKLLIGGDRNLLPNGDLSTGDATGWPDDLAYTTDAPDGCMGSVFADVNRTTTRSMIFGHVPVTPGNTLVFETWLKADKPGSRMYFEIRDQDGTMIADSDHRWTSVEGTGPASSYLYPVANYEVPTEWTHLVQTVDIRPGAKTVYFGRIYFNHLNGSERDAIQQVAGTRMYEQVGTTLIQGGAITTEKIAVGAITAESGVVGSLDAGKITVGTLDVARLAANSITADKVLLTSGSELAADPWFDGVDSVWAGSSAGEGSAITTENPMPGHNHSAKMNPRTSGSSALYAPYLNPESKPGSLRIPCQPGETYDIYAWVMRADGNASNVGNVDCRVYAYTSPYDSGSANNSNGRAGGPISGETFPVGEWVKVGGSYTVPAGRYSFTPRLTVYTKSGTAGNWPSSGASTWYVGAYSIMRQVGSTLIEPGAITTEKLATGAITAESGVIGSLDASKITVGKLSGARLEADAINGMQIIGATIATSTGFPRTQMDASGISAYSSSSVRTFFASASTGNVSITGELYTGAPGSERVTLDNSLWTSVEVVDPETDVTYYTAGAGVRVGVDSTAGIDIYHGSRSVGGGKTVELGAIRGANSDSRTDYGSVKINGTRTGGYVRNTAFDQKGVRAASVLATSGGYGADVRKAEMAGCDAQGTVRAYVGTFGNSGDAEIWARDSANKYSGRIILQSSTRGSVIRGHNSNGDRTAEVGVYGSPGSVFAEGSNINPFTVNYLGKAASWVMPFQKNDATWGYIGSSGAMSVNDFGIQSASGKQLNLRSGGGAEVILNASSGSRARVSSLTIAKSSGSVSSNASSVYIRPSSGVLMVSSSSERYKEGIEDARDMPSILDVQTRTWLDKNDIAESEELAGFRDGVGEGPVPRDLADAADEPRVNFGAIAEEVDGLGLHELVRYDVFDRPDGLNYEMFGVALIPEVRKLRDRIAALEAMLDTPTETTPVE